MHAWVDEWTQCPTTHTWLEATLLESMNSMAERPCGQLAAGHSLVPKHRRGLFIALWPVQVFDLFVLRFPVITAVWTVMCSSQNCPTGWIALGGLPPKLFITTSLLFIITLPLGTARVCIRSLLQMLMNWKPGLWWWQECKRWGLEKMMTSHGTTPEWMNVFVKTLS